MRRLTEADQPAMKALYTTHARRRPGHLDRGPYVWVRTLRTWRERPTYTTGVFDGDRLAGYVVWRHAASEPPSDVQIGDVVTPSPAVARRIWGFLKDHSTMAPAITGFSSPTDPFWRRLAGLSSGYCDTAHRPGLAAHRQLRRRAARRDLRRPGAMAARHVLTAR